MTEQMSVGQIQTYPEFARNVRHRMLQVDSKTPEPIILREIMEGWCQYLRESTQDGSPAKNDTERQETDTIQLSDDDENTAPKTTRKIGPRIKKTARKRRASQSGDSVDCLIVDCSEYMDPGETSDSSISPTPPCSPDLIKHHFESTRTPAPATDPDVIMLTGSDSIHPPPASECQTSPVTPASLHLAKSSSPSEHHTSASPPSHSQASSASRHLTKSSPPSGGRVPPPAKRRVPSAPELSTQSSAVQDIIICLDDAPVSVPAPKPTTWNVDEDLNLRPARRREPRPETTLILDDSDDDTDVVITGEVFEVEPAVLQNIATNVSRRIKSELRIKLVKTDFCIGCRKKRKKAVCPHPLFEGGLCETCKMWFADNVISFDKDRTNSYCAVCSYGDDVFICETSGCPRVFCRNCVRYFGISTKAIQNNKNWQCFMCSEYTPKTHGCLRPRKNWLQELLRFYHPSGMTPQMSSMLVSTEKRPLRVLSLFDGIGTGRIALRQLGLVCEKYYGCEIDEDALTVTKIRLPDIIHLGDVQEMTAEKVLGLGPIDLLIGGSPCNEFSLINHKKQGLSGGTGLLFFEYHRILNIIQKSGNHGHYLFFLYENVYPMMHEVRDTMTRFFESEPTMWDAGRFSAQRRRRYFWGNIPGLHIDPEDSTTVENTPKARLDDVLMPSRKSIIECVRTVTTNPNSLRWSTPDNEYSVRMGKKLDTLWLPELEQLFGLEPHFTDVCDMNTQKRRKLIGKTWSIPVIKHLLGPLRHFYLMEK